ncbi:TRAP-type C4-dicarboxylate transport system permease small subunit [Spinactinospora alkalitolerans]|uniref:TRAP-type C4-dicarboxylate transport system permease small subunit n=1 Tax=Spinactinospora alkalitolerans TaxID=687207 RepID=A0A852TX32_9ACTN|nr:TRAP transporter small permease [Spinactinospora alkalitolerans]NYE47935.1 TRAP-type C4-dicarboxylate transport system permease small subunit [Spinactinospora alkalitolerans]
MRAVKEALDKILAAACVVLFTVLVLTVSWQVFTRQVLNAPSGWSEELSRYVFVWLGLFGAALVFSERGHIAVDFIVRKLAEGVQRVIAVVVQLAITAFAVVVLVWGGWRASRLAWETDLTSLPVQVGPLYLVMPITGMIITFYAVYHVVLVLRRKEPAIGGHDTPGALE